MDIKESELLNEVMRDSNLFDVIKERMRLGETLVGIKFHKNGKNYKITDGSTNDISKKVEELKRTIKS